MKGFLSMVLLAGSLVLATSGCSSGDEGDAAAARLMAACPMTVQVADREGQTPRTLIEPARVVSLRPAKGQGGEDIVMVTLDDEGARRMASYTKRNIGSYLAVLCGDREMSVAKVMSTFSREFQFTLPDEPAP
jgi:preprotein translocase subunit SecD